LYTRESGRNGEGKAGRSRKKIAMQDSPSRGKGRRKAGNVGDSDDDSDEGAGVKPAKLTFAEDNLRSPRLASKRSKRRPVYLSIPFVSLPVHDVLSF
jgi:hypothetical protein